MLINSGPYFGVIECKRPSDHWIFLVPDSSPRPTLRTTVESFHQDIVENTGPMQRAMHSVGQQRHYALVCADVNMVPSSIEAMFCVTGKTGTVKELETPCRNLLEQTTGLASMRGSAIEVFIPIIVTTARLFSCRWQPDPASLADGKVGIGAEFVEESVVRFRKSFVQEGRGGGAARVLDRRQWADDNARTVMIVQATKIVEFLAELGLEEPDGR